MTAPSKEDIEWFKSTFHPIPKPQLPDDCIEYSLYLIAPINISASDQETRDRLSEVRKSASTLVKNLLKDYIWQREGFKLEIVREDGLSLLRGHTEYGDSIEDEWVIVYLLRELSKQFEDLWVKVTDNDGEFLLVEAAATLPTWLGPEVADNRVWIHNGELVIIKPKLRVAGKNVSEKLTFRDARAIVVEEANRLLRSPSIEEEAFYRLRNYPKQIADNLHTARISVPRKIAFLLHLKPAYISPAVQAFYTRDPIALRPLQTKDPSNLIFQAEDFVTVSAKFTRVGYAQLKSQDFDPPTTWRGRLPLDKTSKEYAHADIGMKLSCGFEMMLSDPQNRDRQVVREIKLVLEDVEAGGERLPTDDEIENHWERREDDEHWLSISFEDLEGELRGQTGKERALKTGTFGDRKAQENLQRIVANFEEFLNDHTAGLDGAELIHEFDSDDGGGCDDDSDELSSEGEDEDVSFDEEEFSRMMQQMMGMPPEMEYGSRVAESESDEDHDDSWQVEELSKQMEAELRETGVLDLNQASSKKGTNERRRAKGKALASCGGEPDRSQAGGRIEDGGAGDDADINLAENLVESFRSQAGSAGPAGNLIRLMGMDFPKDDR